MVSDITLGKQLAKDDNITSENQANRFQPGEPIYLEMKVGGAPNGTPVKVLWSDANTHQKMAEDQKTVGSKPKYIDFQAKDAASKKKREKILAEGKLAPEVFDKAFAETPKAFYVELEKQLDVNLAALVDLGKLCDEKFKDASPSFGKLRTALDEVRHVVFPHRRSAGPSSRER